MKAYIIPNLDKTNCELYTRKACEILKRSDIEIGMDIQYQNTFFDITDIVFGEHGEYIKRCDVIIVSEETERSSTAPKMLHQTINRSWV